MKKTQNVLYLEKCIFNIFFNALSRKLRFFYIKNLILHNVLEFISVSNKALKSRSAARDWARRGRLTSRSTVVAAFGPPVHICLPFLEEAVFKLFSLVFFFALVLGLDILFSFFVLTFFGNINLFRFSGIKAWYCKVPGIA